jgi:uncharacterized protein YjbI with pentapeptide repeats
MYQANMKDVSLRPPREPDSPDRIEGASRAGADLQGVAVRDLVAVRCDGANVRARGASFVRVVVEQSRLTGADLGEAELQDVVLRGCRFDLAGLRFARLTRVLLEDCELRGSDFGGAVLSSVAFASCGFDEVDFSGASFTACEMRGCVLDGVRGVAALRGVAMPWPDVVRNAGAFAGALGVRALEE